MIRGRELTTEDLSHQQQGFRAAAFAISAGSEGVVEQDVHLTSDCIGQPHVFPFGNIRVDCRSDETIWHPNEAHVGFFVVGSVQFIKPFGRGELHISKGHRTNRFSSL